MNDRLIAIPVLALVALVSGCAHERYYAPRPPVARPAPAPLVARPAPAPVVHTTTYVVEPEPVYVVEPTPVYIHDSHRRPRGGHDYDRHDSHPGKHHADKRPSGSSKPVAKPAPSKPSAAKPSVSRPAPSKPATKPTVTPKYHHAAPARSSSDPSTRSGSVTKVSKSKKR